MKRKLLFICTGNTCRSPMAAGLMGMLLRQEGLADVEAESAGLAAHPGEPASENAVQVMKELGIDLRHHAARRASGLDLASYEAIYVMSESHKRMLEAACPAVAGKIKVLGGGVPDPFGGSPAEYRLCRDNILAALKKIVQELKQKAVDQPGGNHTDEA